MTLYILDSDHLSLLQHGNQTLKQHLESTLLRHEIAITVVSVEELLRGRLAQIRRAQKVAVRVAAFYWLRETLNHLCNFNVIEYSEAAEQLVKLWRSQRIRIGSQDLRIAAIAHTNRAVLVTRNRKDFSQIPNLAIESWV